MRTQVITALLLAGTVVGCASNPPPPPPMAAAPEPAPAAPPPAMMGPMAGTYKGVPDLAADAPSSCRKISRPVTVRVMRNNTFTLAGIRGTVGPDGAITGSGRSGSLMGTASATGLDVTTSGARCNYHYMLTKG